MPDDLSALTTVVNETKGTLNSAAKTIRSLIQQRNEALVGSDPDTVREYKETVVRETSATRLHPDLEAARQDTEAAIAEANATPKLTPKKTATQPQPHPAPEPAPKTMTAGSYNPTLP